MKITNIRTLLVDASYGQRVARDFLFVFVDTDEGITGVGEATNWPGGPIIEKAVHEIAPLIIGEDPSDIETIWPRMYEGFYYVGMAGVVMNAISGIEMACWDVYGKALGVPVYKLLGGKTKDQPWVYANYWALGLQYEPEAWATKAKSVVNRGYSAIKFTPFLPPDSSRFLSYDKVSKAIEIVAAIREAVGPEVMIGIEAAGWFDVPTAIRVARALEPYKIEFIEEPIPPENIAALKQVQMESPIPLATGERLHTRWGFRELIETQAASLIQPDPIRVGGLLETKKIADYASVYYTPVAPHNANGPVATAAALHLALCCRNIRIVEYIDFDVDWRDVLVSPPFKIQRNGCLNLSDAPGLGVDFNEEIAKQHPGGLKVTRNPAWHVGWEREEN